MKINFITIILLLGVNIYADSLDKAVSLTVEANQNSIKSQSRIDKFVDKQDRLYSQYIDLSYELKSLNSYNRELQEIVDSQNSEKNSTVNQINKIDETKREILPLIRNMLISLEELIESDTPFLYDERKSRVNRLKKLIKRSDISIASKYRSIIEAYEIENEYSKTIETYSEVVDNKSVNYLRLGRVALYYITDDKKESAIWDNNSRSWQILDSSYSMKINSAIKIASKKSAPNLLTLPLFKAKEVN